MTMIDRPLTKQVAEEPEVFAHDVLDDLEIAQEPTEDVIEVTEPELPTEDAAEIPDKPGGWKVTADAEQRQRLYAAQKAADILREFSGSGVFSTGGTKSVNPVDVITLAQWIVYGTHDQ